MTDVDLSWPVPDSYRKLAEDEPEAPQWLPQLPRTAARWAERWGVIPDGPPMHGWISMVWPVRPAHADRRALTERFVLKVSPPVHYTAAEPIALRAFGDHARPSGLVVAPRELDVDDRVMLLPRLDPGRSLQDHLEIDQAVDIVAAILASIADVAPPPPISGHPLPTLTAELDRLAARLAEPSPVPVRQVERALATIGDLRHELAQPNRLRMLHNDCHFLNVLGNAGREDPPWIAIDPLPIVGIPEWELTPMLRNRYEDAAATGDPDRSLRRRVGQVAERVPIDRELARACAQLSAVGSLHHLLPDRADHLHAPAYQVMATW